MRHLPTLSHVRRFNDLRTKEAVAPASQVLGSRSRLEAPRRESRASGIATDGRGPQAAATIILRLLCTGYFGFVGLAFVMASLAIGQVTTDINDPQVRSAILGGVELFTLPLGLLFSTAAAAMITRSGLLRPAIILSAGVGLGNLSGWVIAAMAAWVVYEDILSANRLR